MGGKVKNIIFGIVASVSLVLAAVISLTLYGRAARQTELDGYLSVSMEQTMKENCDGKFNSDQEMIDGFVRNLIVRMDSESDLAIEVLGADTQRGMLSVEVVEKYQHPLKKEGKIASRKTIILDRQIPEDPPESYTIRFYRNRKNAIDSFYAEYRIQEGDALIRPTAPVYDLKGGIQKRFLGWCDENGQMVELDGLVAAVDRVFYAKFE